MDAALVKLAKLFWWRLPAGHHTAPPERRTPVRWTAVSALAKGADRLVARQVLARDAARLQAILPFDVDEYRKDFDTPEDRDEFDKLFASDPEPTQASEPGQVQEGDQPARQTGYLRGGQAVVEACEILIAVWDGQPAKGTGGTAEVVQYAVQRDRLVIWVNAEDPDAQPQVISADHGTADAPASQDDSQDWTYQPLSTRASDLSPAFHQLAAYNRDTAFDLRQYRRCRNWQVNHLREYGNKLPPDCLAPVFEQLVPHYAWTDQLALRYQRLYRCQSI